MIEGLRRDLNADEIDLLWITHQHSDPLGGAPAVIEKFTFDRSRPLPAVRRARDAAANRDVDVHVVDLDRPQVPFQSTDDVSLRAVLPSSWPHSCDHNANNCSIGLRVDYCKSSILFVGDAEQDLEEVIEHHGPVTLLPSSCEDREPPQRDAAEFYVQADPCVEWLGKMQR